MTVAKWKHCMCIILSMLISWHSIVRNSFPFLLIDTLTLTDSYSNQKVVNYLLSSFILIFKLCKIWPVGGSSSWLYCPFETFPSYFEHFLTGMRCSRFVSYFSWPSSGIRPLSKGPRFLLVEDSI